MGRLTALEDLSVSLKHAAIDMGVIHASTVPPNLTRLHLSQSESRSTADFLRRTMAGLRELRLDAMDDSIHFADATNLTALAIGRDAVVVCHDLPTSLRSLCVMGSTTTTHAFASPVVGVDHTFVPWDVSRLVGLERLHLQYFDAYDAHDLSHLAPLTALTALILDDVGPVDTCDLRTLRFPALAYLKVGVYPADGVTPVPTLPDAPVLRSLWVTVTEDADGAPYTMTEDEWDRMNIESFPLLREAVLEGFTLAAGHDAKCLALAARVAMSWVDWNAAAGRRACSRDLSAPSCCSLV